MTENRRRRERWKASSYFLTNQHHTRTFFDVQDRRTRQSIGHLVDLTIDGLRIEAAERIDKGRDIELSIQLPKAVDGREEIQIKARCMWCMEGGHPGVYHAGFAVLTISPPFAEVIGLLMED